MPPLRGGLERVPNQQPLPVALTIGAKEDEINRRILGAKSGKGSSASKGQAAPAANPDCPTIIPLKGKGSLLSRVDAKGGVKPPTPFVGAGTGAPTPFGQWIIDSALQEAREADELEGEGGGEERFEFNSPNPLDLQSAAAVNQALSRAVPSLETVIGEQVLGEGVGADFVPAAEGVEEQLG